MRFRKTLVIEILVMALVGVSGSPAAAQRSDVRQTRATLSEPVTVALVESLPQLGDGSREYQALILRRRDLGEVILLPRAAANGEMLDAATRTLLKVRTRQLMQGDQINSYRGRPVQDITVGVKLSPAPAAWKARHVPLAQKVVDRLNATTNLRTIEMVGTVKAVRFYPPAVTVR